jgi:hypothetical protein
MGPDVPFCVSELMGDEDRDGYTRLMGCAESVSGDCAPSDASRHPGARELCNALDDDCDGAIDESMDVATWCADGDGDGYGDPRRSVSSCAPVAGHVLDCTDCFDSREPSRVPTAALVHPGQVRFFATPYTDESGTPSFDYDCSGEPELEHELSGLACNGLLPGVCLATVGWQDREPPPCGETGSFATCRTIGLGAAALACYAEVASRSQRCR